MESCFITLHNNYSTCYFLFDRLSPTSPEDSENIQLYDSADVENPASLLATADNPQYEETHTKQSDSKSDPAESNDNVYTYVVT